MKIYLGAGWFFGKYGTWMINLSFYNVFVSLFCSCFLSGPQTTKQKKKTGVMLPRVVLTPLKVNGAHMESASGEHCFCFGDFLQ